MKTARFLDNAIVDQSSVFVGRAVSMDVEVIHHLSRVNSCVVKSAVIQCGQGQFCCLEILAEQGQENATGIRQESSSGVFLICETTGIPPL